MTVVHVVAEVWCLVSILFVVWLIGGEWLDQRRTRRRDVRTARHRPVPTSVHIYDWPEISPARLDSLADELFGGEQ